MLSSITYTKSNSWLLASSSRRLISLSSISRSVIVCLLRHTLHLAHEPDFPFDVLHVHFVISFLFVQEARRRVALSIYALCNLNLPYPIPLLCGALVSAFAYSVRLRAGLCFPVVIIVYYIAFNISIDIITNIAFNILLKMYIAFNRQTWYNKTTMGGEAEKRRAPGDNITGGAICLLQRLSRKPSTNT